MTEESLFEGVCNCIRGTLEKELPDMAESDRLISDLGADSLDLLDLVFRLEQKFGVSINPRDIERRTQAILGEEPMQVEGCYTARAIEELKRGMPEIPEEELTAGMPAANLIASFRVKTIMNLVAFAQANRGNT